MIKKLNLIFVLFLIISFPISSAQHPEDDPGYSPDLAQATDAYDSDGDRVCDRTSSELGFVGRPYGRTCYATKVGDLCANTPKYERAYTDDERSGCSESQLAGMNNYWSVEVVGNESRPVRINLNWLTDQPRGVDVYVPVIFKRNPEFMGELIEFGSATFNCRSEKNYGRYITAFPDREYNKGRADDFKYTLQINIRRLTEEEAKDNNILDESLLGLRSLLGTTDPNVLAAIKLDCSSRITQVRIREEEDGEGNITKIRIRPVIPHENDEFKILIPLERLAIQPPDAALERGIEFTEALIEKVDKIVPGLEKARQFTLKGCIGSIIIVLGFKVLSGFGFSDYLNKAAEFIWYGWSKDFWEKDGVTRGIGQGFSKGSFFISGRAMCSYSVCPATWCRYLQQPGIEDRTKIVENEEGEQEEVPEMLLDEMNRKTNLWLPPGMPKRPVTPQDSLILSSVCGCISGIELNLLRIQALAREWNRCLTIAKETKVYVSYCDKELNKNICKYLVRELKTFYAMDLVGNIFRWMWGKRDDEEPRRGVEVEVGEAAGLMGGVKKSGKWMRESAEESWTNTKNFFNDELKPIGTGQAGGNLGYYTDTSEEVMLCEIAIYRRMPELNVFERFGMDKAAWETTIAGEWTSEAAYRARDNRVVRAYSISWTIIAGSDDFPYEVYLRNEAGGRRILDSGRLAKAGDLTADFKEITDEVDYSWLCVDVSKELYRTRCFPPGKFSEGGPLDVPWGGDDQKDTDLDRLPDDWEIKYNCEKDREFSDFLEEKDYKDCVKLLEDNPRGNRLDPNKKDTDGDGKLDWQENPDGDIYNNYDEFEMDYNPNIGDETSDGQTVTHDCWVKAIGEVKFLGTEDQGVMKYKPGDSITLGINGFSLGTGKGESVSENNVKAKVEIYGPDGYYKLVGRKSIDEIENGIKWGASKILKDGFYNVRISYETKPGAYNYEPCIIEGTRGNLAKTEEMVLIYDKDNNNCIDSDEGRVFTVGGMCIDSKNKIEPDKCTGKELIEFYCEDNSCTPKKYTCKESCSDGACSSKGIKL